MDTDVDDSDRPLVVVHGNCQAESVRLMMDAPDVTTVRIPPAHELSSSDLPGLFGLLSRADVLISQPIRDNYRGLPIGTGQLASWMPTTSTTLLIPVIRFAGLYPFHLIVRPPHDTSASPPLVAYHDARLLRTAYDRRSDSTARVRRVELSTDQVLEIGRQSLAELSTREERHSTLVVSDVFDAPTFAQMRTINHPGNAVWSVVSDRIRSTLGYHDPPADPGRPLLDSIHAPRLPVVAEAYGLTDPIQDAWVVDGRSVDTAEVEEAHLEWYHDHPDAVDAGMARHGATLATLGLG
ncbi:hypothetical protein IWX81_002289 [Salinibacterium sp. CAN_S4]|uniref:WcbI family polysaccharide biosynthesis putative acetyltransferase n=1 Tax=Salinibacterium sp. CAN_S4 TaxID=2787727 RepID=UPI0018F02D23